MAKRKLPTEDTTSDWNSDEKLQLLEAMKAQCPDADKLSFSARLNKVDWEKVEVEGRSAEECQEAWHQLSARVRKFRTLDELMEDAKDMITHPEKYLDKKHKVKHPDQPVKPLTAYFQYVKRHRGAVKAEHPELNSIQLTQLLSQKWQALPPEKQNKYIKRYKKQWAKFQEANAKFLEEHPELNKAKRTKPRPPTPFSAFVKAKTASTKEKHPEMDKVAVQKKLREKYGKLSPEKKKKWIQRAVDAVPDYEEEVKHYQRLHPDFEPPTKKVRLTREEAVLNGDVNESQKGPTHSKKVKFPGAPEKPPPSAFHLFMKKKLGGVDGPMKDKMRTLSQQWKQMSNHKRNKYTKKLNKLRLQYRQQLETFKETLTPDNLAAFEESLKPQRKSPRQKEKAEYSSPADSPSYDQ